MLLSQRERPVPLPNGPAAPHLVFSLTGFTFLSALEIIQTSQLHPPAGTKRHLILLLLQNLPLTAAACYSVPDCNPYAALHGMQYPAPC